MIVGDMASSASGQNAVALGAAATASHANSVALGAGAVTEAAVATASTTIAGQTYGFAGAQPVGTLSIGTLNNERTLTNVAAGRIALSSTDAINGSQLHATNLAVERLDNVAVKYDQNPDGSKSNTITLQGRSFNTGGDFQCRSRCQRHRRGQSCPAERRAGWTCTDTELQLCRQSDRYPYRKRLRRGQELYRTTILGTGLQHRRRA